jgi:phosphotriesterase-related protein
MSAPIVRTVLGDIDPATLGPTYMHEHLILDSPLIAKEMAHIHLPSVDEAVAEAELVAAAGATAMVDTMPCAGGRHPERLAEISRRSGIHVIATTGLHTEKYYAGHRWALEIDVDAVAALFAADIAEGIDHFDYTGPVVRRSKVRAGIIKIATGDTEPDERARRLFTAAVDAHRATGAPILTHCEEGAGAREQIELLSELGMDLSRVVISHTDKVADPRYHDVLLSSGVNLEYDQALRQSPDEEMGTAWLLAEMVRDGFGDQIMLGTDGARRSLWTTLGGAPGLAYLRGGFVDVLRTHGISEAVIEKLFIANPARFLAFDPEDPR